MTGFGPDLDLVALGYTVLAFSTIEIAQGRLADVIGHLEQIPEVIEAHTTTGQGDLHVRVVGRTNQHLSHVLNRVLEAPGISRTTTVLALAPADPLPGAAPRRRGGRRRARRVPEGRTRPRPLTLACRWASSRRPDAPKSAQRSLTPVHVTVPLHGASAGPVGCRPWSTWGRRRRSSRRRAPPRPSRAGRSWRRRSGSSASRRASASTRWPSTSTRSPTSAASPSARCRAPTSASSSWAGWAVCSRHG